jgi:porin
MLYSREVSSRSGVITGARSRARAWTAAVLVLACELTAPDPARADSWLERDHLSDDWGGARKTLDDHGVTLELDYTAEAFAAPAGLGGERPLGYRGTIDVMMTLDSHGLGLWPGGTLFVYGQNGHGGGISERLGAAMPISNLEAPAFTQLAELWYEHHAFSERVHLRLGKQDANHDFAAPRFGGNFVHSSFGVPPTVPMPSFPAPGLGAMLLAQVVPWLSLRSGVYEASPEIESFGFDPAFDGGGPFLITAVETQHGVAERSDAALYSAGGWYRGPTPDDETKRAGLFATADVLWPIGPGVRTLQTFVRAGWATPDDGPATLYVGGGTTYHALRDDDTVGLGAGHIRFRDVEGARPLSESFLELFYKAHFAPWLALQPDVQVVFQPGGVARTVLVTGARMKLKL